VDSELILRPRGPSPASNRRPSLFSTAVCLLRTDRPRRYAFTGETHCTLDRRSMDPNPQHGETDHEILLGADAACNRLVCAALADIPLFFSVTMKSLRSSTDTDSRFWPAKCFAKRFRTALYLRKVLGFLEGFGSGPGSDRSAHRSVPVSAGPPREVEAR
jgi:hypothetical protein